MVASAAIYYQRELPAPPTGNQNQKQKQKQKLSNKGQLNQTKSRTVI
jgi:hypothetical protein